MMKRLFLFTLLVSGFLVISCSNKNTTGVSSGIIDHKWHGTYAGEVLDLSRDTESVKLFVDANGFQVSLFFNSGTEVVDTMYSNETIMKVSDNTYVTYDYESYRLIFASDHVKLTSTELSIFVDEVIPKIE